MAKRPVFISTDTPPYVKAESVEFNWHKGLSVSQKQKSIRSLHKAALEAFTGIQVLEISTKSENVLGIELSAFNLMVQLKSKKKVPLENVFQSSKVFEKGGPFRDLLYAPTKTVKSDHRLKESGDLIGFFSNGKSWPLKPRTIFYDWLYINTLKSIPRLAAQVIDYDAFTDIEFNPKKSFNCQASSAALFVSLSRKNILDEYLSSPDIFLSKLGAFYLTEDTTQNDLFD